jgi:hypothetical protein
MIIALTLILAGATSHRNVDVVTFNYPATVAQATYDDALGLHTVCTGSASAPLAFTYNGATPQASTITATKCVAERIFKGGFQ